MGKQEQLREGVDIAQCPSCSLIIKIIYDPNDFLEEEEVVEN